MRIERHRQSRAKLSRAALAAVVVFLTACSSSVDERSAVVSGRVTLGGAPVSGGTVLLMTDDGHAATAELSADGTYVAHCRPGNFKVAITPPAAPDPLTSGAGSPPPRTATTAPSIPRRYQDLSSSGLKVELREGDNKFDIALTR